MLTRHKHLRDYGIPAEDIEKLNNILKDFPEEYTDILHSAALSACPKGLAELITYGILHQKGYDSMTLERYVPINRRDFYAYKRKTLAELYDQMRLFGMWKGNEDEIN